MILEQLKQYKPYSISPGYNTKHVIYDDTQNEIIKGTTYPSNQYHKAIEGIVHSHIEHDAIFFYDNQRSLLTHYNQSYIEYDFDNERFMIVNIDHYSHDTYRLLLATINYLYNEYHLQQFQDIYEDWRHIDMSLHLYGQQWDANEYKLVERIAMSLTALFEDIIMKQQDFMFLHYDSVKELLSYLKIDLIDHSLAKTFLFQIEDHYSLINIERKKKMNETYSQKEKSSLLDIMPLYTDEDIKALPLFLQNSLLDNQALYLENREFLDQNDFDLIKSFYRGKTWSCLYYGPSGTGKTTKILCLAGALGLPSMKMVGSRSIDESSLFGKYVLRNGETIFEYGPLALMMKYGGMFIFDEINMVDSDILSSLNDVLDGTKQKILDNGEIIRAHKNFRFAESMNIGYAGTNEMNISHKSRIQNKIKISKLSIDKMTDIIVKETHIEKGIARKMASMLDGFNNVIMNIGNETTQRIDLRTLINWAHKSVDLDGDVIRASLVTIISELAEEDDDILNLDDVVAIMATDGAAGTVMEQIVQAFCDEE